MNCAYCSRPWLPPRPWKMKMASMTVFPVFSPERSGIGLDKNTSIAESNHDPGNGGCSGVRRSMAEFFGSHWGTSALPHIAASGNTSATEVAPQQMRESGSDVTGTVARKLWEFPGPKTTNRPRCAQSWIRSPSASRRASRRKPR